MASADWLERFAEARDEHDVCPVCGEEYIDVDGTKQGNLYFIHEEHGSSVSGCEYEG